MPRSRTPEQPHAQPADDAYAFLHAGDDPRPLRRALAIALGVHLALLAVTFPSLESRPLEPPPPRRVHVLEATPIWKRPEPPKTPPKQQRARPVPMPDPTPDDPEPVPVSLPLPEPDIDLPPDRLILPDSPPLPTPVHDGPHRVGGEIAMPERQVYIAPRYTELARRAGIQGNIILEATIDRQGHVVDIQVLRGLPMGLTEAVVEAVKQWRYEPALLDGKPVPVAFVLTVRMQQTR